MASTRDLQEGVVGAVCLERRRSDDNAKSTLGQQFLRPFYSSDSAAHARGRFRREHLDEVVVRASAHGGVEIDDLNLRERGEASQHFLGAVAFERLLAALHELDDLAIHEIDTRNDHWAFLTGIPARSRDSLRSLTVYVP